MTMHHDETPPQRPAGVLATLAARLLGLVAALLGLGLMFAVLLFGLLAGTVLAVWSLLRGRRPSLRFGRMPAGAGWERFRSGPDRSRPNSPKGEVVDVEVREVSKPPH